MAQSSQELIPEDQFCDEYEQSKATVKTWRARRRGPAWIKIGRKIFYARADIDRWLASLRRDPAELRP